MTSKELAKRAGISLPWLHRLVQLGLIEPSIRKARKQGSPAEWGDDDLDLLLAMKRTRVEISKLGRCKIAPIRLRSIRNSPGLLIVGKDGAVSKVPHKTSLGQLMRMMGCSFAVIVPPSDPPA